MNNMLQKKSSLHTSQLPRSGHGILRSFVTIDRGDSRRKGSLNHTISALPVVLIFVFEVIIHFSPQGREESGCLVCVRWRRDFVSFPILVCCELSLMLDYRVHTDDVDGYFLLLRTKLIKCLSTNSRGRLESRY